MTETAALSPEALQLLMQHALTEARAFARTPMGALAGCSSVCPFCGAQPTCVLGMRFARYYSQWLRTA